MDILQQSLQAADILSGEENDDLFRELGLTFNTSSTEHVDLESDLAALASEGDSICNSGSGNSIQNSFESSSFDTSQFLNTSAPVNASVSPQVPLSGLQDGGFVSQGSSTSREMLATASAGQSTPYQFSARQNTVASNSYQSMSLGQGISQSTMQSSVAVTVPSASIFSNDASKAITTVAQNIMVATCNSTFSKVPTQSLTTSVQMRSATPSADTNQTYSVQNTTPASIQLSTPIQIVQPSATNTPQGQRQMITLVQKPSNIVQVNTPGVANQSQTSQVINGLTVQPQQNNNVAVLKIAGKHSLNLSDPQVVKALTATIQKQQVEAQTSQQSQQPQFIKLGQNLINVVAQRPQQQQITLQNGQTILLNNSQHVQICAAQSQSGQMEMLQTNPPFQYAVANAKRDQTVSTVAVNHAASRNTQVPIKGIQIASVNIPIASSSTSATSTNLVSVPNTVLAIPVVAKQDPSQNSINQQTIVTQANSTIIQTQNSATVRSLLANAILKQNNSSSNNSNLVRNAQQLPANVTTSDHSNANIQSGQPQVGAMLRLNITPQQASQLTPSQLQAILKRHQASLQARAAVSSQVVPGNTSVVQTQKSNMQVETTTVASSARPFTPTSASSNTNVVKPVAADQGTVQVFKVDPTLTETQIDEVKKLLANRTIASKLQCLTKEQQQLVLAFQAQIKTMSPPVQQYYLRNPQLFMQKVLQQVRLGKPFILQVKSDTQQRPRIVSTVNVSKQQHPTISLTQDSERVAGNRVNTPSPVPMFQHQGKLQPGQNTVAGSTRQMIQVQVSKHAIKRSAPEHPAKVSLVLEQLDCHKKMVSNPDCTNPFKSIRDAIRRLVPFHTCNIPNVKEENFDESEKLFEHIADRIVKRTKTMVNKYHLLCLRDSTRDSCSAEMVMVERMFLQKEKAKLAEDKARILENPSVINEYFPRRSSEEDNNIISDDDDDGSGDANPTTLSNDNGTPSTLPETDISIDSPLFNNGPMSSRSTESGPDFRINNSGRYSSYDSGTEPPYAKRSKQEGPNDMLLQEAVDSILM